MINEELRRLREKAGITQSELARVVNKKRVTVSSWETGRRNPGLNNAKKIADFYDVPVDHLIQGNSNRNEKAEESALSSSDRAGMIETLRAFSNLPESYYKTLSDRKIIQDYEKQMDL